MLVELPSHILVHFKNDSAAFLAIFLGLTLGCLFALLGFGLLLLLRLAHCNLYHIVASCTSSICLVGNLLRVMGVHVFGHITRISLLRFLGWALKVKLKRSILGACFSGLYLFFAHFYDLCISGWLGLLISLLFHLLLFELRP